MGARSTQRPVFGRSPGESILKSNVGARLTDKVHGHLDKPNALFWVVTRKNLWLRKGGAQLYGPLIDGTGPRSSNPMRRPRRPFNRVPIQLNPTAANQSRLQGPKTAIPGGLSPLRPSAEPPPLHLGQAGRDLPRRAPGNSQPGGRPLRELGAVRGLGSATPRNVVPEESDGGVQ